MAGDTKVNPVVVDWENTRWIRERGGSGELLIFRSADSGDFNRRDLHTNKDIIAPVLKHLGNSAFQLM